MQIKLMWMEMKRNWIKMYLFNPQYAPLFGLLRILSFQHKKSIKSLIHEYYCVTFISFFRQMVSGNFKHFMHLVSQ